MYIAKLKRGENIAEYLLYIWQIEDLIRALDFNHEKINQILVVPQGLDEAKSEAALSWYEGITNMLISEDKKESGHISHTEHLVADIHDLHLRLLANPVIQPSYRAKFSALEPYLPMLRAELKGGEAMSDTMLMFKALYSVILLRLKGNTQSSHASDVIETVSPVVALLADTYKKVEQGEIDLFKEE